MCHLGSVSAHVLLKTRLQLQEQWHVCSFLYHDCNRVCLSDALHHTLSHSAMYIELSLASTGVNQSLPGHCGSVWRVVLVVLV